MPWAGLPSHPWCSAQAVAGISALSHPISRVKSTAVRGNGAFSVFKDSFSNFKDSISDVKDRVPGFKDGLSDFKGCVSDFDGGAFNYKTISLTSKIESHGCPVDARSVFC